MYKMRRLVQKKEKSLMHPYSLTTVWMVSTIREGTKIDALIWWTGTHDAYQLAWEDFTRKYL